MTRAPSRQLGGECDKERSCRPLRPVCPALPGTQGSGQKKGALDRWCSPRLLTPPYLREGSESPEEQESQQRAEGAHPGGGRAGLAASAHLRQPAKHAVPEPTCSAGWGTPRRRQTSLGAPCWRLTASYEVI